MRMVLRGYRPDESKGCLPAALVIILLTASTIAQGEDTKEIQNEKSIAQSHLKKCKPLPKNGNLTENVHVLTVKHKTLQNFLKTIGVYAEITQMKVRTAHGHQYFVVRDDSVSAVCKPGTELDVVLSSVEPQTDVVYQVNPCCTSTTGGDAQAQWFNLTNCPLYKPRKLADWVCGH